MKNQYPNIGERVYVFDRRKETIDAMTFLERRSAWTYWRDDDGVEWQMRRLQPWEHDRKALAIRMLEERIDGMVAHAWIYDTKASLKRWGQSAKARLALVVECGK